MEPNSEMPRRKEEGPTMSMESEANDGYGCGEALLKLMFRPSTLLFLAIVAVFGVVALVSTDLGEYLREETRAELEATPVPPTQIAHRGCLPLYLGPVLVALRQLLRSRGI